MLRCLSQEQLDDLLDGRMQPVDQEVSQAHLEACLRCRRLFIERTQVTDAEEWRCADQPESELDANERAILDEFKASPERFADGRGGRTGMVNERPVPDSLLAPPVPRKKLDRLVPQPAKSLTIAGFDILGELGRGGMGVVYKARQIATDRTVALKMILAGHQASAEDLGRFHDEAEAISRLRHPHIVQILDVGQVDGRLYFVLEFIEGGTLADKVRGQALPPRSAAQLLESLARAMHYAHERGIIHRDLKPANVLLHGRRAFLDLPEIGGPAPMEWDFRRFMPKITDFGLAKLLDRSTGNGHTAVGDVVGTPSYMAPEQAQGRPYAIGPTTDVYSLGAVLYELLTACPPFQGATPMDTLYQVHRQDPIPPRKIRRDVPQALETICLKCLRKEPQRRYLTAEDLAEDLRLFLDGQPIRTRGIRPFWESFHSLPQRAGGLLFVGLIFLLALVTGGAMMALWLRNEQQQGQIKIVRNDAIEALRDGVRLRLRLAHGEAERGHVADGLFEMVEALQSVERSPELDDLRDAVRASLAAWSQRLPVLRWQAPEPAGAVAFAPDDRELFLVGPDRRLLRWSIGGSPRTVDLPDSAGISAINVAANGSSMTAVTSSGLRWWNLADGKLLSQNVNLVQPYSPALSPDGNSLAVRANRDGVRLWLLTRNAADSSVRVEPLADASPSVWAWHPAGAQVLLCGSGGTVQMQAIGTSRSLRTIGTLPAEVNSVGWIDDGRTCALGCADGVLRFLSTSTPPAPTLPPIRVHREGPVHVAAARSGLVITAGADRQAKLWQTSTGELLATLPHADEVEQVQFTSDGKSILTRDIRRIVRIWDVPAANLGRVFHYGGPVSNRSFISTDGRRLAVVQNEAPSCVKYWELSSNGEVLFLQPDPGQTFHLAAFQPGTDVLVTGIEFAGRSMVQCWNKEGRRTGKAMPIEVGQATAFAFHDNGRKLMAGTSTGRAMFWDLASQQLLNTSLTHSGRILAASFRPDGEAIALAGHGSDDDGEARVWLLEKPEPLSPPLKHRFPVVNVSWEQGGRILRTIDSRRHLRRWDPATGQRLDSPGMFADDVIVAMDDLAERVLVTGSTGVPRRLSGGKLEALMPVPAAGFLHATFSRDGRMLATAWTDGVRLYDARLGQELGPEVACANALGLQFTSDGRRLLICGPMEARLIDLPHSDMETVAEWREWLRRSTGLERVAGGLWKADGARAAPDS